MPRQYEVEVWERGVREGGYGVPENFGFAEAPFAKSLTRLPNRGASAPQLAK